MNSLDILKYNLAKDVAKASRFEVYGLHYSYNWIELIMRRHGIKALDIDDEKSYYTEDQRTFIMGRLGIIGKTKLNGNTKKCCN